MPFISIGVLYIEHTNMTLCRCIYVYMCVCRVHYQQYHSDALALQWRRAIASVVLSQHYVVFVTLYYSGNLLKKDVYHLFLQDGNYTALIFACEQGHSEVVHKLLLKGADVNKKNKVCLCFHRQCSNPTGWYQLCTLVFRSPIYQYMVCLWGRVEILLLKFLNLSLQDTNEAMYMSQKLKELF